MKKITTILIVIIMITFSFGGCIIKPDDKKVEEYRKSYDDDEATSESTKRYYISSNAKMKTLTTNKVTIYTVNQGLKSGNIIVSIDSVEIDKSSVSVNFKLENTSSDMEIQLNVFPESIRLNNKTLVMKSDWETSNLNSLTLNPYEKKEEKLEYRLPDDIIGENNNIKFVLTTDIKTNGIIIYEDMVFDISFAYTLDSIEKTPFIKNAKDIRFKNHKNTYLSARAATKVFAENDYFLCDYSQAINCEDIALNIESLEIVHNSEENSTTFKINAIIKKYEPYYRANIDFTDSFIKLNTGETAKLNLEASEHISFSISSKKDVLATLVYDLKDTGPTKVDSVELVFKDFMGEEISFDINISIPLSNITPTPSPVLPPISELNLPNNFFGKGDTSVFRSSHKVT